ncbi:MAG: hypothetical protein ACK5PS_04885 [Desulfopila sp.]
MHTPSIWFRATTLAVTSLFLVVTWAIPFQANARSSEGRTRMNVHHDRPHNSNRSFQHSPDVHRNFSRSDHPRPDNRYRHDNDHYRHNNDRYRHDNDRYHHDDHHHWDRHDDWDYHHHHDVGGAFVVGALTGLVVGNIIAAASVPPSCSSVYVNGYPYRQCGSTWLQPQYQGSQVTYVVVNPPR